MPPLPRVSTPLGREVELGRLDALLDDAAAGTSRVLALRGDPGVGKTTLLDETAERAAGRGATVLRTRGFEAETDLPYAALLDLVRPVVDLREQLPDVQARALGAAMALEEASPHDRFAVPAGLLGLLALAAERAPVVAILDDLQWMDPASRDAVLFAARRLEGESVAMVLGVRNDPATDAELADLDVLDLRGLSVEVAAELAHAAEPDLAPDVASRVAADAAGNPLAVLEVAAQLTAAQRLGSEPLSGPLPVGETIERAFARRVDGLPETAAATLLVLALLESGDAVDVEAAAAQLGLDPGGLDAAVDAGLVTTEGGIASFRHPLLRATLHGRASEADRRRAHGALAAVLDDDRLRAWHAAQAALTPDAAVADDLDAVARDALARGAHAAAAGALDLAADVTPDAALAATRRVEAATQWIEAGHPDRALATLGRSDPAAGGPALASTARRVRAQVELRVGALASGRRILLEEGERVAAEDPAAAAAIYMEAATASMMTGDMVALVADADRARELGAGGVSPLHEIVGEVVAGEAQIALGRVDEGDRLIAARNELLRTIDPMLPGASDVLGMAGHSSFWAERWDRAQALLEHVVAGLRAGSAFGRLVYPLAALAQLHFRRGRWRQALAMASESARLARTTGQLAAFAHAGAVLGEIEAALGRTEAAQRHAGEAVELSRAFGARPVETYGLRALGFDHLAQGRPEQALEALERATRLADELQMGTTGLVMWLPDHVEALVAVGRKPEAPAVVEALERRAVNGGAWGPAAVERCRGILATPHKAEAHFDRALVHHEQDGQPFERARTLLSYGERLRAGNRAARAREVLGPALETFHALGARPWAARAQAALVAAGGSEPPAPGPDPRDLLTPEELQVALMTEQGRDAREVAAALFLSAPTVERQLVSARRKLGLQPGEDLAPAFAA